MPFLGETLLRELAKIIPEFEPNDADIKELKETLEKIRDCKPNPDYNIRLAKSICQKLIDDNEAEIKTVWNNINDTAFVFEKIS